MSAAGAIYADYFGSLPITYLLKPLTMLLVISIAAQNVLPGRSFYGRAILVGLTFSLIGDIFLMQSGRFIPGLLSFLAAHLCTFTAFVHGRRFRLTLRVTVVGLIYGITMTCVLLPRLGAYALPVIVYILVILSMGQQACERWSHLRTSAARQALIGAMLFIFSDSVLALNRFRTHFDLAPLLILSSYFTAQWFLAISIGEQESVRLPGEFTPTKPAE